MTRVSILTAITLVCSVLLADGQTFELNQNEYSSGEDIVATWTGGPANAADWVGIYSDPGDGPVNGENVGASTIWLYSNGTQTSGGGAAAGSVAFTAPALPPGSFIAFFLENDGYTSIAPAVTFDVVSDGVGTLALDAEVYDFNLPITTDWSEGPGNAADWVGIYRPGEIPGDVNSTLWAYTNGTQTAGGSLPSGQHIFAAPSLAPGNWLAYFFENDGYSVLAGPVAFSVTAPPASIAPQFIADPFRRVYGVAGSPYSGKLAAHVRDDDIADTLTFSKTAGPGWLSIAADGTLSGTPELPDLGFNTFGVSVSDSIPLGDEASFTVEVFAPGEVEISSLKALSFNVWVGTNNVDDGYDKGLESILVSDADIVAVSENNGRAAEWADDLGWHVFQSGSDDAVLSRYPITETFTASASVGARVRVAENPLREVNIWSCHLSPNPYGPYEARDAAGDADTKIAAAIQAESDSGRLGQINAILAAMQSQLAAADEVPVMLIGDFNTPSHLDWTPDTAIAGAHFGLVVEWPVTLATEAAGLSDTYRVAHPDPLMEVGDTWTPIDLADIQDRIDMIHVRGAPLSVVEAEVFTTLDAGRWPSDHAGVLAEFHLHPVDVDDDGLADSWEIGEFGSTEAEDGSGDPNGDGRTNFETYALGEGTSVRLSIDGESGELVFSYPRIRGGVETPTGYEAGGIRYNIEWSEDLKNWSQQVELPTPVSTSGLENSRLEEAVYALPPTTAKRRHLRLRLTQR